MSFPKQTFLSPSFNGIGDGGQAHVVGATGRSPLRPLQGWIREHVFPWIPVFTGMTEGGGNGKNDEGNGVGRCEGRGDFGVRFDVSTCSTQRRLNELRGGKVPELVGECREVWG